MDWLDGRATIPRPHVEEDDGCPDGRWDLGERTPERLTELEAKRAKFFDVEVSILVSTLEALSNRAPAEVWRTSRKILVEEFAREDLKFLLEIDESFQRARIERRLALQLGRALVPCARSASALLSFLAHVEAEMTVGCLDRTKSALMAELGSWRGPTSFFSIPVDSLDRVGPIVDECWRLLAESRPLLAAFERRFNEALENEFDRRRVLTLRVRPKDEARFELVEANAIFMAEHVRQRGDFPPILPLKDDPKVTPLTEFADLSQLRWEEVQITVVSKKSVRIEARGVSKTLSLVDAGFGDGRSRGRPTRPWELLLLLAKKGEISWATGLDEEAELGPDRIKATVASLRKGLQALLRIQGDPFHPYRKVKAYKPVFRLRRAGSTSY